jgi:hypothetical protein
MELLQRAARLRRMTRNWFRTLVCMPLLSSLPPFLLLTLPFTYIFTHVHTQTHSLTRSITQCIIFAYTCPADTTDSLSCVFELGFCVIEWIHAGSSSPRTPRPIRSCTWVRRCRRHSLRVLHWTPRLRLLLSCLHWRRQFPLQRQRLRRMDYQRNSTNL